MQPRPSAARATIVALLMFVPMASGGCGFIFTHAPPEGHEQMDYFTCTENNAGPIVDVIWAGLNVLGALIAAADPDAYEDSDAIIAVGLGWGVLSGAGAGVGFTKTKKCQAAKRALAQRQGQMGGARQQPPLGDTIVQAVVVNPDAITMVVGQRAQLVATALNSSGGTIPNKVFTWSSSNDAIASVSNAGQVTAHAVGSVVIAANTDNIVGTTNVVVRANKTQ